MKSPLQSKTIHGNISTLVAAAVIAAAYFGVAIDPDTQARVVSGLNDIAVAVGVVWASLGSLYSIYGRLVARDVIGGGGNSDSGSDSEDGSGTVSANKEILDNEKLK